MTFKKSALEPRWLLVFSFFIAGIFLGGLSIYVWANLPGSTALQKIHPAQKYYAYVNPLLAVDLYQNENLARNKALELRLAGLLDKEKRDHDITAAVYFRDIENGFWVGFDENRQFSPGKLLKIPIMIAYYKLAGSDPSVLKQKMVYSNTARAGDQEFFGAAGALLMPGRSYTADELIDQMIRQNDDNAANLLFDNIDKDALNEVFSDLGINFREDKETIDFIPLKFYSLFFRVLYNATYLDRAYSEKALENLVATENSIGLGAGLPKDVAFANRQGARSFTSGGPKTFEAYDCGVVYAFSHPYVLCATAQGKNQDNVRNIFRQIGQIAYEEVRYEYGN